MSTITLSTVPGFSDLSDAPLAANQLALGTHLSRVNVNASFGIVRLEFFTGIYSNGDTVPLPTSPVDGYTYSQNELIYMWVPANTGNLTTGFASYREPWTMWYGVWNVNQATGAVSSEIGYRGNNDHKDRQATTNDGQLQVFTIAQRQKTSLTMGVSPSFVKHVSADFAVDFPLTTGLLTDLNHAAKFGVINTEVIYLGEFFNGQLVPKPVSPVDGHTYAYSDCLFQTSWRWTADADANGNPQKPAINKGQLQDWSASVSVSGLVEIANTAIEYELSGQHLYNTGKVAVFAFCTRAAGTTFATQQTGFAEILDSVFAGGSTLRASTLQQLNNNVNQALCTPEFFGPTVYTNGQTVAIPTSPLDGYTYQRSELTYIWDWANTGPATSGTGRLSLVHGSISAAGLVTVNDYRLNAGASTAALAHEGQMRVVIVAKRAHDFGTPPNPKLSAPDIIGDPITEFFGRLDDIPNGATYGRALLTRLDTGRPLIDFAETIHLNKVIDNLADGNYMKLPASPTSRNLFPNSGFKSWGSSDSYWNPSTWVLVPAKGPAGGNAIGWLGTGVASGFPEAGLKRALLLAPGNYTLSANMDASQMTTQHLDMGLYVNNYQGAQTAYDGGKYHLSCNPGQSGRQFINFALSVGAWIANHAWAVNDLIIDSNGHVQVCTTAGTGGASAPTWATTVAGVTTDNAAHWACINTTNTLVPFNILMFPSNAVITSGQYVTISEPQLEIQNAAGVPTPYTENVGDDIAGSILVDLNNQNHGPMTISTKLNPQGSIIPGQSITITISFNDTSISLSWSAQTMLRADGSTISIPAGSKSYTGLTASTKYYIYCYVDASTGVITFINGTPPGTGPSTTLAIQTAFDGRFPLPAIVIQTLTPGGSGGSSTGGGGAACPEESELVEVLNLGRIRAEEVEIGMFIKGYSFAKQQNVYRKVVGKFYQSCCAWRLVNGYRVTPCEAVFIDKWLPAFRVVGSEFDDLLSYKVDIEVEADEDYEHNFWLTGKTEPLLIHNAILAS